MEEIDLNKEDIEKMILLNINSGNYGETSKNSYTNNSLSNCASTKSTEVTLSCQNPSSQLTTVPEDVSVTFAYHEDTDSANSCLTETSEKNQNLFSGEFSKKDGHVYSQVNHYQTQQHQSTFQHYQKCGDYFANGYDYLQNRSQLTPTHSLANFDYYRHCQPQQLPGHEDNKKNSNVWHDNQIDTIVGVAGNHGNNGLATLQPKQCNLATGSSFPADWCRWPVCQMYYLQATAGKRQLHMTMPTNCHNNSNDTKHTSIISNNNDYCKSKNPNNALFNEAAIRCPMGEFNCPDAHAGPEFDEVIIQPNNCVRVCYDSLGVGGRYCRRPPGNCRFFHPPEHIRNYLLQERFLHPKRVHRHLPLFPPLAPLSPFSTPSPPTVSLQPESTPVSSPSPLYWNARQQQHHYDEHDACYNIVNNNKQLAMLANMAPQDEWLLRYDNAGLSNEHNNTFPSAWQLLPNRQKTSYSRNTVPPNLHSALSVFYPLHQQQPQQNLFSQLSIQQQQPKASGYEQFFPISDYNSERTSMNLIAATALWNELVKSQVLQRGKYDNVIGSQTSLLQPSFTTPTYTPSSTYKYPNSPLLLSRQSYFDE